MRVLFLEAFDFVNWSLSIIEENEPTVLTSSSLSKIHLNEVFSLFQVFMNDVFFNFTEDNWFSFDTSEIGFMLNEVNNASLRLSVQNQVLSVVK